MVKKATEYGAVEIWMNERVRRACANSCADFLYGFLEVCYGTRVLPLSCRYSPVKSCAHQFIHFCIYARVLRRKELNIG